MILVNKRSLPIPVMTEPVVIGVNVVFNVDTTSYTPDEISISFANTVHQFSDLDGTYNNIQANISALFLGIYEIIVTITKGDFIYELINEFEITL